MATFKPGSTDLGARSVVLLLVGAVVGAGAVLLWPAGLGPDATDTTETARPAAREPQAPPSGATLAPRASTPLADLAPTPAEASWLREKLQQERARAASAAKLGDDDGVQVLTRVLDEGAAVSGAFSSFEAFRERVRPSDGPPTRIDLGGASPGTVVAHRLPDPLPAGGLIEFGPGTFQLQEESPAWEAVRHAGVDTLEIRGAGIDKTTLRAGHLWALVSLDGRIRNLVLRDFTFDGWAAQGSLLDLRGESSVRMESVRVRGWLLAGHGAAVGVSGRTYLVAENCEFDGGGRMSGWGLSVRAPALVWARRCLFTDLHSALSVSQGGVGNGRVLLEDCTFVNARVLDREAGYPVEVLGGRMAHGLPAWDEDERLVGWGRAHLAVVRGVTTGPGVVRCRVRDLIEAVEQLGHDAPESNRTLRLELEALEDGRPSRFTWHRYGGARSAQVQMAVRGKGERWTKGLSRPKVDANVWPPEADLAGALSLREALNRSPLGPDVAARAVHYALATTPPGEPRQAIVRVSESYGVWWELDARTGALLRKGPGAD